MSPFIAVCLGSLKMLSKQSVYSVLAQSPSALTHLCVLSTADVLCPPLSTPAKHGKDGQRVEYDWFFTISCWREKRERRHVVAHGPRTESSAQQSRVTRVPLWQQLRAHVCAGRDVNRQQLITNNSFSLFSHSTLFVFIFKMDVMLFVYYMCDHIMNNE